jgi:Ohr subfamily peroxiredoxin
VTEIKVLYTAEATAVGGRSGHARSSDGRLDVDLSVPEEMQGDGGPGTNPEQLFAAGYAACFESAMAGVARGVFNRRLELEGSRLTARVGIGPTGHGGFGLTVYLDLHAPQLATDDAVMLTARAAALSVLERDPR